MIIQYYMYKSQSETSQNHEKNWRKAKQQPIYTHLISQLTWGKQDKVVQDKKSISLTPWLALKIFWATDYKQVKTRSEMTFN